MGSQKVNQQKKFVYRPNISGNRVTYRHPNGRNVSANFYGTLALPMALSKAVTGKTPNVTKADLKEALWDCSEKIYGNQRGLHLENILQRAEALIDHYAEKITEGEPKGVITQNEQFEIMERWHHWYGHEE